MKLEKLRNLDRMIRNRNETYTIFSFIKNKVKFDIFFDISATPYRIGFLVLNSDFQLWIDVQKGYEISTNLKQDDYKRLCSILGIKFDPGNPFSPFSFFEEFSNQIPNQPIEINLDCRQQVIIRTFAEIEERDKIYYLGQKDWDKYQNGKKRTPENLEKTRLLYPSLYDKIKSKNISVLYTADKHKSNDI